VEFAVEIDVLEDFGAVGLEGGAEVVEVDAGGFFHEPVGDAGRDFAGDGVVDAVLAPAAGEVVALVDFFEEIGDVFGLVLEVAIEGDDDGAGGFVEAGGEGGGLAEVAAEADDFEAGVGFDEVGEEVEGAVCGGVVDEDDFVLAADAFEDFSETVVERQDGRFFVVNWNDDRKCWHRHSI